MDIYSLTVTHIFTQARPMPMSAPAEDRYYSDQIALPRLGTRLGSTAVMAGVILILAIALI